MPVQISMTIDENTKQRFDEVCAIFGVTPSSAINMFITDAIRHNSIPFDEETRPKKRTREEMFDCARGRFNIPDDFNEPLEDFGAYDEGPKVESILGILEQYADPSLVEQEKGAWERAAAEKYLEKMKEMNDDSA